MNVWLNCTATNTTHLLWVGRWIEAVRVTVNGESGWQFKCGRDAADWLRA
jgi:hypothetical protein